MRVIPSESDILEILEFSKQFVGILLTPSPMDTDVRLRQSLNVLSPSEMTEFGIIIEFKFELLKAKPLIFLDLD